MNDARPLQMIKQMDLLDHDEAIEKGDRQFSRYLIFE